MTVEINHDHLGYRLAQEGTRAYRVAVAALAEAVRDVAPGTAAALVDWDGTEAARLRAYAVARNVLREQLAEREAQIRAESLARGDFRLIA